MDLIEGIMTARSIRRFTDEPVTEDELMTILRAANQAPSGGNIQPWQFLVVTDPTLRRRLREIYEPAYFRYEAALLPSMRFRDAEHEAAFMRNVEASRHLARHLDEAPAIVLVLQRELTMTLTDAEGELDVGSPLASVYPAVQNLMLAARGLGIGSALTTVYRVRHDEVRALFDIPADYQVVAMVPLGRPRGRFGVAPRRPVEKVTHWDRFGSRR